MMNDPQSLFDLPSLASPWAGAGAAFARRPGPATATLDGSARELFDYPATVPVMWDEDDDEEDEDEDDDFLDDEDDAEVEEEGEEAADAEGDDDDLEFDDDEEDDEDDEAE